MSLVRNRSRHVLDLTGGGVIERDEVKNVNTAPAHEQNLLAEGALVLVDPTVGPPDPPEPLYGAGSRDFEFDWAGLDWHADTPGLGPGHYSADMERMHELSEVVRWLQTRGTLGSHVTPQDIANQTRASLGTGDDGLFAYGALQLANVDPTRRAVYFPPGAYEFHSPVPTMALSSVRLVGEKGLSRIRMHPYLPDGMTPTAYPAFQFQAAAFTAHLGALASDGVERSREIVLTAALGFAVGQWVYLEVTDAALTDGQNGFGQLTRITAMSGDGLTLKLAHPLYDTFPAASTTVFSAVAPVEAVTVEDLWFDGLNGDTNAGPFGSRGVMVFRAARCTFKGLHGTNIVGDVVHLDCGALNRIVGCTAIGCGYRDETSPDSPTTPHPSVADFTFARQTGGAVIGNDSIDSNGFGGVQMVEGGGAHYSGVASEGAKRGRAVKLANDRHGVFVGVRGENSRFTGLSITLRSSHNRFYGVKVGGNGWGASEVPPGSSVVPDNRRHAAVWGDGRGSVGNEIYGLDCGPNLGNPATDIDLNGRAQHVTLANASAVIGDMTDTSFLDGESSPGANDGTPVVVLTGGGLPAGTRVKTVDSGTQITLTQNATVSGLRWLSFTLDSGWVIEGRFSSANLRDGTDGALICNHSDGGLVTVTADYTVATPDRTLLVTGTRTITLPAVILTHPQRRITVKNAGSGSVTVQPLGVTGALVDGAATKVLAAGEKATFMTDRTNWFTV